eukprot:1158848-Pelagomonas_calceolata.AAC.1
MILKCPSNAEDQSRKVDAHCVGDSPLEFHSAERWQKSAEFNQALESSQATTEVTAAGYAGSAGYSSDLWSLGPIAAGVGLDTELGNETKKAPPWPTGSWISFRQQQLEGNRQEGPRWPRHATLTTTCIEDTTIVRSM